jgi:hypothetical protein
MANADYNRLLDDMLRSGVFEDRMEYSTEDLQSAYSLTETEAKALHGMIQDEAKNPLPRKWHEIDSCLNQIDDAVLGKLVKEYIGESLHGSWEGYRSSDLTGMRRMFTDMILYHRHSK